MLIIIAPSKSHQPPLTKLYTYTQKLQQYFCYNWKPIDIMCLIMKSAIGPASHRDANRKSDHYIEEEFNNSIVNRLMAKRAEK